MLCSCSYHADDRIVHYLETANYFQDTSEIMVDLQTILGIKYDSMYIFTEFTNSLIPIVLGETYHNRHEIVDSKKRIILFYNGKIVYEDDIPIDKIYFEPITECMDTMYHCYLVHYGSIYKIDYVINERHKKLYRFYKEKNIYTQYEEVYESDKVYYIER